MVRWQALREKEPLWSPPTRRVAQAFAPPLLAGLAIAVTLLATGAIDQVFAALPAAWMILFGCGLAAAGFFMRRGIKLFGVVFVAGGVVLLAMILGSSDGVSAITLKSAHWIMGGTFGGLHLLYGAYLSLTEKPTSDL